MPRRSQWEHLKEEVCEQLKAGVGTTALKSAYPDIPDGTIKSWARAVRQGLNSGLNQGAQPIPHATVEVLPPRSTQLVAIDGAAEASDFALARRTLRGIAKDNSESGAVRVQASLGLLKMTAMRAELPRHVLEEIEETNLNDERDRLADIPAAELARRYREALG